MKWRAEFNPFVDNGILVQVNQRCDDLDGWPRVLCGGFGAGFGSHADQFVEDAVVLGAAVGIAGAVRFDRADENLARADHLGPRNGDGQEVSVAKGHVARRDIVLAYWRIQIRFAQRDGAVRQGRPADLAEYWMV